MLTLVEAAKLEQGNVVRSAVIEMFARASELMALIPFDTIKGNAYSYNREATLPGVAFRGINEAYSESTGVINPVTESLYICGGDLDVDRFIVQTQGPRARAAHVAMKIKSLADTWGQKFIKGDNSSDPREFDGLQVRLTGNQLIDAGSTSGGDALSLAKLDELIDAVENPQALVMSRALRRLLTVAGRTTSVSGYVTHSTDTFGNRVTRYNDIPIVTVGLGSTEPLGFNEANPGGGSAVGTSIYCLSFGDGMLKGIQQAPIDARDLGEINDAPKYRTRVEWYAGIALEHGRAAARLRGIKNAAVTA